MFHQRIQVIYSILTQKINTRLVMKSTFQKYQWPSRCKTDHEIRHDTNKRENTKETIKYRY